MNPDSNTSVAAPAATATPATTPVAPAATVVAPSPVAAPASPTNVKVRKFFGGKKNKPVAPQPKL